MNENVQTALKYLSDLGDAIQKFLRIRGNDPDWTGPDSSKEWTIIPEQSGEDYVAIQWRVWDGDHYQLESIQIDAVDLWKDPSQLKAEAAARFEAKKARDAFLADEKAAKAKRDTEFRERETLRALLAKYGDT